MSSSWLQKAVVYQVISAQDSVLRGGDRKAQYTQQKIVCSHISCLSKAQFNMINRKKLWLLELWKITQEEEPCEAGKWKKLCLSVCLTSPCSFSPVVVLWSLEISSICPTGCTQRSFTTIMHPHPDGDENVVLSTGKLWECLFIIPLVILCAS